MNEFFKMVSISLELTLIDKALIIVISQCLNKFIFSLSFKSILANPSSWAVPNDVKIPMVGFIISSRIFISPTSEMPASKMAKVCWLFNCQTDIGTPICEL